MQLLKKRNCSTADGSRIKVASKSHGRPHVRLTANNRKFCDYYSKGCAHVYSA